jgi:hypothetical protein
MGHCRLDILVVAGADKRPIEHREEDIVEVKCCRDTDPTTQLSQAENQHDASPLT